MKVTRLGYRGLQRIYVMVFKLSSHYCKWNSHVSGTGYESILADVIESIWPYNQKLLKDFTKAKRKVKESKSVMAKRTFKDVGAKLRPYLHSLKASIEERDSNPHLNSLRLSNSRRASRNKFLGRS